MKIWKSQGGGITLEAAFILPLFLVFILAFIVFIKISIVQMALQSAVSESTKVLAANMYPIKLIYAEVSTKYGKTSFAEGLNEFLEQAAAVKEKLAGAEEFAEDYAAYLPESFIGILRWEKKLREQGEEEIVNFVFKPIVLEFADRTVLKGDKLRISKVIFPDFENGENDIGIEAQYFFPLRLPFIHREFILQKHSYERAWLGA